MKPRLYILGILLCELFLLLNTFHTMPEINLKENSSVQNFTQWVQSQHSPNLDYVGVISAIHGAEFYMKGQCWISLIVSVVVICLCINLGFKLRDMAAKTNS